MSQIKNKKYDLSWFDQSCTYYDQRPSSRSLKTYHINYISKQKKHRQVQLKQIKHGNYVGNPFLIKKHDKVLIDSPRSENKNIFDI